MTGYCTVTASPILTIQYKQNALYNLGTLRRLLIAVCVTVHTCMLCGTPDLRMIEFYLLEHVNAHYYVVPILNLITQLHCDACMLRLQDNHI